LGIQYIKINETASPKKKIENAIIEVTVEERRFVVETL
jgi:hypothetical protein